MPRPPEPDLDRFLRERKAEIRKIVNILDTDTSSREAKRLITKIYPAFKEIFTEDIDLFLMAFKSVSDLILLENTQGKDFAANAMDAIELENRLKKSLVRFEKVKSAFETLKRRKTPFSSMRSVLTGSEVEFSEELTLLNDLYKTIEQAIKEKVPANFKLIKTVDYFVMGVILLNSSF